MTELTVSGITSQYIGKPVSKENLAKCSRRNGPSGDGQEYIVYSCGFIYDEYLRKLFGITDRLKDIWNRSGTDFNIYLVVGEKNIVSCDIKKIQESQDARPCVYYLKCTQQELRVARRILDYVTKE